MKQNQNQNQNQKRPQSRKQPRKDSSKKRVNFDNTRVSKFDKDVGKQEFEKGAKAKDCNDISWYAKNKMLLDSAASFNIASSTGEQLTTLTSVGTTSDIENSVPGVMVLRYFPYLSGGNGDAVQRAKSDMYSFVVHANSRNQSYDDSDLMFVHIAGSQVFAAYALGVRAYGTMRRYAQEDQYTPEALVTAMGFYYSDLKANLSKMWFDLNELAARLQQIWIPDVTPVTQRWYWMNSHIYRDGNSVKSQYYLFTPSLFYVFQEKTEETGTSLSTYPWAPSIHSWAEYMNMMNTMINNLLNSQDRGIMFGDILKAYGADHLYAVTGINADYVYEPVYNAEVLTQIENATMWGISSPTAVVQDANGIISTRMTLTSNTSGAVLGSTVLNYHQLTPPTPEQNMIATRLKTAGVICTEVVSGTTTEYRFAPLQAGTEVIDSIAITSRYWLTNGTAPFSQHRLPLLGLSANVLTLQNLFEWCAFDWAPWLYVLGGTVQLPTSQGGVVESVNNVRPYGDWDNYTYISPEVLRKMHLTAVYSEFGVPSTLG